MASGVTLAAAAPAGAATSPAYYQGVTSANVLGVALHLPAALPALPNIPKDLALNLIGVNGNAIHDTLAGTDVDGNIGNKADRKASHFGGDFVSSDADSRRGGGQGGT